MKMYHSSILISFMISLIMTLPLRAYGGDTRFEVSELVVKDRKTGLVWARNGAMARDIPEFYTDVTRNINSLIIDLNKEEYGDCGNWHIPSKEEFETLLEFARGQNSGGNSAGNGTTIARLLGEAGFRDIDNGSYWTSTTYRNHAGSYWYLFMTDGKFTGNKAVTSGVLPVCFNSGMNADIISKGRVVFKEHCAACHDLKEAGAVNPDTGTMGKMETRKCKFGKNYSTIINGIRLGTAKGMPQFKNILSTDHIYAVTIYVLTLRCGQGQLF